MKKWIALLLALTLCLGLCACGSAAAPATETETTVKHKIGVIVYNTGDEEVIGFREYLQGYIEDNFEMVEFLYSPSIASGEEELSCTACGQVLERREIPALPYIYAEEVTLSAGALELTVGQEARLTGSVAPADATEPTVSFRSSDEAVAKVLPDGDLQALRPGTATVTATSADGHASAACTVTVSYTPWQWVKHYVLFGWIWE